MQRSPVDQPYRPPVALQSSGSLGDDAGIRMLIPVGRSGLAIAAGYVGLISILVFPLGPIAILLGVLAMRDIDANPEKHGMGRVIFAFIVGGLATLVLFYFIFKVGLR